MSSQHKMVYVRRGNVVKGPIPLARVAALLKAGKLLPSDEVAASFSGPWASASNALSNTRPTLPVIDTFTITHSLLYGRWVAVFQCPKCGESLECGEKDMATSDVCPKCRQRFLLSPRAADETRQAKKASESRKHERRKKVAGLAAIVSRWLASASVGGRRLLLMAAVVGGLLGIIVAASFGIQWYKNNTPAAKFDRFVWDLERELKAFDPLRPRGNIKRDLRKTDSLTSPYVGSVVFPTVSQLRLTASHDGLFDEYVIEGDAVCEIACNRSSEGVWFVEQATMQTSHWRVAVAQAGSIAGTVAEGMNREGVKPEVVNSWDSFVGLLMRTNCTYTPAHLTELNEGVADLIGGSHEFILDFKKLEHVEPGVIEELIAERRSLVEAAHGEEVWPDRTTLATSLKAWPYRPTAGYGVLVLDRLRTLSDELAGAVADFRGTVSLGGIETLSDTAAERLGSHYGSLWLPSLRNLTPRAALMLARHAGALKIGVTALSDEALELLAKDTVPKERWQAEERKHIELPGLAEISAAGITAVTGSPVRFSMPGLKTLTSVPLAKKLIADTDEEDVTGESLEFGALESVSGNVEDLIAEFPGDIRIDARKLQSITSVSFVKRLVADAGSESMLLDELRSMSAAAAGALADYSGALAIAGISEDFDLTADVAAALASHTGELKVNVKSLAPEAAAALAGHKGRLEIHSREEVPRSVRDSLKAHRGKVKVTEQNPKYEQYLGGEGMPVVSGRE